ncbi:hypothetical protein AGMMS49545_14650 [Betaproteobacteria bacterium]|nr:hypothetical protein AGMMS49545_14650 [Betaproteobacteria bacterium]GHU41630.1 hypothetical protein AGMMS50289_05090 [Betaproteobacteria bacterium]
MPYGGAFAPLFTIVGMRFAYPTYEKLRSPSKARSRATWQSWQRWEKSRIAPRLAFDAVAYFIDIHTIAPPTGATRRKFLTPDT